MSTLPTPPPHAPADWKALLVRYGVPVLELATGCLLGTLVAVAPFAPLMAAGVPCPFLERHGQGPHPWRCGIYKDRPDVCRDFEVGGRLCGEARQLVGLPLL